jgi:hypothetical protein
MKHTVVTCAHLLAAPQWTFVDAELDAGTKLDAIARRSDLSCSQRESEREARGVAKRSARHKWCATQGVSSTRREA